MAGPSGGTAPLTFPTDDIQTVKVWSKKVEREILPKTLFGKFLPSGITLELDELSKGPGDVVKVPLEALIAGDGKMENETLEGAEEAPSFYQDELRINQLRQAVRWYGRIDQQRVVFNFRESGKNQLVDWWADRIDTAFMNQVCGRTSLMTSMATNDAYLKYTGLNDPIAPSANNLISDITNEFSLAHVNQMITRAKSLRSEYGQPIIRPVRISGGEYWPILLHTFQYRAMRENANPGQWLDIQKAAMAGGLIDSSPIFTGSSGIYNGAIFFESDRVPPSCNWSVDGTLDVDDTAVAALIGMSSVGLSYGRDGGRAERYIWSEDSFDLGNEHAIAAALIHGMKKLQFGATGSEYDYGVIACATASLETSP